MLVALTTLAMAAALVLGLGAPVVARHVEIIYQRDLRQRLELENQRHQIDELTATVEGYRELVTASSEGLADLALPDLGPVSTPVQVFCLTR